MRINLLTRCRRDSHREVRERTLPAMVASVVGLALLLGVCVVGIAVLPAVGYLGWTFAAVAFVLAFLVLGLWRQARATATSPTGRRRWFRRILRLARLAFMGILACWLGLIAWLALCPGGVDAPAKADPDLIRVVTWNIHCGQDEGPPWKRFDWPNRKAALRTSLERARPDILCAQEATPVQVAFLEQALPAHRRVGVGRDDGDGEHCAIYFDRQRFEEIGGNTFWLEEPIDQPRPGGALDVKRICTWVRLRDRVSGRTLCVYNTHLPLTEARRQTAVKVILAQIAAGDQSDAVVLTADFNATPAAPSRRLFQEAGLADSSGLAPGQPTLQLYGIGLRSIDGILVDRNWRIRQHRVLKDKPHNLFPSDHFAVLADLWLE